MGYTRSRRAARLGDISTEIVDRLTALNQASRDVQTGTQQLAQKLTSAGNAAVRVSNQATGAAAGAKAGASAGGILPASVSEALANIPQPVLYGGAALLLWKLFR
jgi:hypothetical protein